MIPGRCIWFAVLLSGVCLTIYGTLHSRMETEQRLANSLQRDLAAMSRRLTLRKVYAGDYAELNRSVASPEKQRIGWLEAINETCARFGVNGPRVMFSDPSVLETENNVSGSAGLLSSILVTETPVRLLVSPRHEVHLAELLQGLTDAPDMIIEIRGCDVSMISEGINADCRFSLYSIDSRSGSDANGGAEHSGAGISQ